MSQIKIHELLQKQRSFFATGETRSIDFRLNQLKILQKAISQYEERIIEAVKHDLNRPLMEAYIPEVGITLLEIKKHIKNLNSWAKPQKTKTSIAESLSVAKIYNEPYGVSLIIAPWNYPFQLLIVPLIGAISAGNCVVLKPSELSPQSSNVIAQMFDEYFDPAYIAVVQGGVDESKALLNEKWDYIMFTGSTSVGRIVMEAASRHLTPVTLELGGKSPCIVDKDIPMETAARRVVWGKFMNCGQTCIAPDYLLVDKEIKNKFIKTVEQMITEFYGSDVKASEDYARIINDGHFKRITKMMDQSRTVIGGQTDQATRFIAPTVITDIGWDHPSMRDEIFGPILPVIEYDSIDEAIQWINNRPKPLALYLFTNNKALQKKVVQETTSGGICINDTISHYMIHSMPFGGIEESGMGAYHGKTSFDTFSHKKSVLLKSFKFDSKDRYAPYTLSLKKLKILLKLMG